MVKKNWSFLPLPTFWVMLTGIGNENKPPCTHLSQTISVKMNQSFGYIYIYISLIIEAFQM
jgi:hypothetical protein